MERFYIYKCTKIYIHVKILNMSYFSLEEISYSSPEQENSIFFARFKERWRVFCKVKKREQKGYPLHAPSLSLCFVVFQARRSIDQIRIEKHLLRTFRVSKHMQMDRWKAVTSGYRLAFESPETYKISRCFGISLSKFLIIFFLEATCLARRSSW